MPNHVLNRLEFKTDSKTMEKIIEKYGKVIPEHFDKTCEGDKIICLKKGDDYSVGWYDEKTDIFYRRGEPDLVGIPENYEKKIIKEYIHFPDFSKVIPPPENLFKESLSSKKIEELNRKGIPNQYDWQTKNWGTKWNSYSHNRVSEFVFEFETAWSSVRLIVQEIANNFPKVHIDYKYSDEDTGYNCGHIQYKNLWVKEEEIIDGSKEALDLAFLLRPHYKDNYKLVNGYYFFIG